MLRRDNIRHGVLATCLLGVGLLATPAGASTPSASAAPQAVSLSGLPDAAGVAEAYLRARRWIDSFAPPAFDDPEARISIENATGICVILRNARRVVGTGTASIGADSEPDLMLRTAVGRAMADVLGDPAVASLSEELRDQLGRVLTLELEVAGELRPLLGRNYHSIAQQIEPGLEGAAMRRGEMRAMLFPSQLRAANAAGSLVTRLPGLASEVGLEVIDLPTLQRRHSISLHRFRTTHLTQRTPAGFPFETFRGDRVVPLSEITEETIVEFADALAGHMLNRLWNAPSALHDDTQVGDVGDALANAALPAESQLALGMKGDYDPVRSAFWPAVAPPLDQALAALALMRYASSPHADEATAARARAAVSSILSGLATLEEGEVDPLIDPAACAVVVILLAERPELHAEDPAIDRLGRSALDVVSSSFSRGTGFQSDHRSISPHAQALLAAAMAARLGQADAASKPSGVDVVREAIDTAWASVPPQQHVSLLPWIGWAELAFAQATGEPMAGEAVLQSIRTAIEEERSLARDEWDPDLAGGFPLVIGDIAGGNRPTAQTSRPAAFFATMLSEPTLTPDDELPGARERHRETLRFLVQLSVRETSEWWLRSPAAAIGGLRASMWDSTMPLPAQALGLMTAVESLRNDR